MARRRRRKKRIQKLLPLIAVAVGAVALTILGAAFLKDRAASRQTLPAGTGTLPGGMDLGTASAYQPEPASTAPSTGWTLPVRTTQIPETPEETGSTVTEPVLTTPEETLPVETTTVDHPQGGTGPAAETTTPEATTPAPTQPEPTTPEPTQPEPTTPAPTAPPPTTPEPTTPAPTTPEPTTPEPTTPAPTEPPTTTEWVPAILPELLEQQLAAAGMDQSELVGSQLLVVHALETPKCEVFGYQKNDTEWVLLDHLNQIPGVLGRNGTAPIAYEGDQTTPLGYFALGPAYGREAWQETGLEYYQIDKEDYFVDDPASKYYNKLYKTEYHDKDWKTAEGMYELLNYYYYCIYIQYNTDPIIPGYGSVIFIHVRDGDPDTSGCIGLEEDVMIALFRWMRKEELPHVLIYGRRRATGTVPFWYCFEK